MKRDKDTTMTDPAPEAAPDMLYGIAAIAESLGMTERQAKHRIAKGDIPAFHMGRMVCASRSGLRAWLADQQAAARHPKAPA